MSALTRPPIYSLEAEEALIGSIFVDPHVLLDVQEIVKPASFYRDKHRWIYEAALALYLERHGQIDALTIADALGATRLAEVGGIAALAELTHRMPTALHAVGYAETVRNLAMRRHAVYVGEQITASAYDSESGEAVLSGALGLVMQAADAVAGRRERGGSLADKSLLDALDAQMERAELGEIVAYPEPLSAVQDVTGGHFGGEITVVAARPGMGKSAWAVLVAKHLASQGHLVVMFSPEMPREAVLRRWIASDAAVAYGDIGRRRIGHDNRERVYAAMERVKEYAANLYVFDQSGITPEQAIFDLKRFTARRGSPALAIVDHLHKMGVSHLRGIEDPYGEAFQMVGNYAKDAGIALLFLAQLNRSCEARADKRPILSDLRNTGTIEQDAHKVLFLYRDAVYSGNVDDNSMEMLVAKNRDGESGGVIRLRHRLKYNQITADTVPPPSSNGWHDKESEVLF